MYRHIKSYEGQKASLTTWIFRIARNTCLNYVRDNNEYHYEGLEVNMIAAAARDQIDSENRIMLLQAFAVLSAAERDLVIMKDYLGFGYREVGQILNLPTGTVKSRLHSVRAQLRVILGELR